MMSLQPERVLLVDDEPQVLTALEDLLSDKFAVVKTTSPEDALRVLAHEHDIAVVVTDQRMPKMTGDQLLAQLGPSCKALRIMVTGFADLNAVIRAVNEGSIFAYVTKPWDATDLRNTVDRAVERFRTAKDLVDEQQLLRDLMVHSPDAIYLKDRELRFVQVNRAFAAQSGQGNERQLLGKRALDVLEDRALAERIESEERELLEQGEPSLDVLRQYSIGAAARWFSESRAPIRGRTGSVVGLLGVARDVTERVLVQQALVDREAQLRSQTRLLHAILDNLAEGVLVADSQGDFVFWNRQVEQILGCSPSGLRASTWARSCGVTQLDGKTALRPEDDPLLRVMQGEPWAELELFAHGAHDSTRHLILTSTPLQADDGRLRGGIALLRDVSLHKALEQRLAQAHKLEAVGRLAGGIAHDFNNLLSVIQGCTSLLLRGEPRTEQLDDLNQVLGAAERAANLTKQLMQFSRQQVALPQVLQLNDVVTDVKGMLARVLGEQVTFASALDPELWFVKADRSQIEQIVVNLTVNARDAMPQGGLLTIATRNARLDAKQRLATPAVAGNDFVVITVSDTGVGMDAKTQARMYEPFYTTKDVGKGTGLGLATVYGIVSQSGGFVTCESRVGQGTAFDVYLPAFQGALPSARDGGSEKAPAATAGTILLVEDEDAVRTIAGRMLRMQGYRVLEASRPSAAKRIFQEHHGDIDLLVTDIVMPESSGVQLAAALVRIAPQLRVVYLSGYAGAAAPSGDEAQPNTWYLEKPFTAKTLLAKVAEALQPN